MPHSVVHVHLLYVPVGCQEQVDAIGCAARAAGFGGLPACKKAHHCSTFAAEEKKYIS